MKTTTKKKTTKKAAKKKVAKKKVAAKAAAPGLDALAGAAEAITKLETELTIQKQKSNLAIMADKIKVLVLFGSRDKLKIRSRFFREKEEGIQNRTLLLKSPTDSQILSTSRVLVQRALKEKGGKK